MIIILKWITNRNRIKGVGESELDSPGSGQGKVEGSSEHRNEPLGSTECQQLLDCLKPISFSRKTSIPSN
jgi:hypothetical protein